MFVLQRLLNSVGWYIPSEYFTRGIQIQLVFSKNPSGYQVKVDFLNPAGKNSPYGFLKSSWSS